MLMIYTLRDLRERSRRWRDATVISEDCFSAFVQVAVGTLPSGTSSVLRHINCSVRGTAVSNPRGVLHEMANKRTHLPLSNQGDRHDYLFSDCVQRGSSR